MRRKKTKSNPTAIITADIEIRDHTPLCRTDDYWKAFTGKMQWLKELQEKYKCPIFDGGDLFDKKYKQYPSHTLLTWAIENCPKMYTAPGNHDLPGKSIENYKNSAMSVLEKAGRIKVPYPSFQITENNIGVYGFPWGVKIEQPTFFQEFNVALVHAMIYDEFEPFPGCEGYSKKELLNLLPDFDLIVCGHHHQTFTGKKGSTILVNPGSLMRNDADQINHRPCVFLWYAEEGIVKKVYVPIEKGVVSRRHIDVKKDKEIRLDAFVEKLGEQTITGINFEKNLEMVVGNADSKITDKVWSYFEG